jgi:glutaminase
MTGLTRARAALAVAAALTAGTTRGAEAQAGAEVQKAVDAAHAKFKDLTEGRNADSIPALAKVDPNLFGTAVVTADGKVYTAGDVTTEVSIQSISKVFTMSQVIQEQGLESIEKRIGVDATGARFNSIIAIEGVRTVVGTGAPEMNPLVNPGAISAASMARGASADEVWKKIIGIHNDAAGLYDDSGKWLYHTGLPAKSGVGGGIIAVSPGRFGIAVVSPPLDDAGNSVRAQKAITDISNALGGNPLGSAR